MKKYRCTVCEWIYDPEVGDPEGGIAPGTAFRGIPEEWVGPLIGVGKDQLGEVTEEALRLKAPHRRVAHGVPVRAATVGNATPTAASPRMADPSKKQKKGYPTDILFLLSARSIGPSGRNRPQNCRRCAFRPYQAFRSGFVPEISGPAFAAGSAPLPRLL